MNPTIKTRPSAVSLALQDLSKKSKASIQVTNDKRFTFSLANSLGKRIQTFELAYKVYLAKGYIHENPSKMLIMPGDFNQSTRIINIHENDEIIASVTLLFRDEINPLPCEKLYKTELTAYFENNHHLVEITRLVIKDNHRYSSFILANLFRTTYVYALQIMGIRDLLAEVNPRHVGFYQKFLNFTKIGQEKKCDRVNDAPAILLHLDLKYIQLCFNKIYHNIDMDLAENSLFKSACTKDIEEKMFNDFTCQSQPISLTEKSYFNSLLTVTETI